MTVFSNKKQNVDHLKGSLSSPWFCLLCCVFCFNFFGSPGHVLEASLSPGVPVLPKAGALPALDTNPTPSTQMENSRASPDDGLSSSSPCTLRGCRPSKQPCPFLTSVNSATLLGFQILGLIIPCTLRDNFPEPMSGPLSQWLCVSFILNESGSGHPSSPLIARVDRYFICLCILAEMEPALRLEVKGLPGPEGLSQLSQREWWSPGAQW